MFGGLYNRMYYVDPQKPDLQVFKNAFIFTIVKLPQTFGVFIVMFAVFALSVYFMFPIFIIGLAFPIFIGVSHANWVFDSYMNRKSDDLK